MKSTRHTHALSDNVITAQKEHTFTRCRAFSMEKEFGTQKSTLFVFAYVRVCG